MKNNLKPEDVTPESVFLNRRAFLKTSIFAASGLATVGVYRNFRKASSFSSDEGLGAEKFLGQDRATSYKDITNYNNFYEFSTDKEGVALAAKNWKIEDWSLKVGGLVEQPMNLDLDELMSFKVQEQIYRFRCVEGWSMVIPWLGFPLAQLMDKVRPLSTAKYLAFESFFDEKIMPSAGSAGLPFPYVEGLRLDEALNPVTLIATGIYGKKLMPQNGAPVRLVVPWKYGFKSIKSISKITLTDQLPPTSWNLANPEEYGFYSNVNPQVDHPRWTQAQERKIGENSVRPTLMFNGYEKEVSKMYAGMDLRKNF